LCNSPFEHAGSTTLSWKQTTQQPSWSSRHHSRKAVTLSSCNRVDVSDNNMSAASETRPSPNSLSFGCNRKVPSLGTQCGTFCSTRLSCHLTTLPPNWLPQLCNHRALRLRVVHNRYYSDHSRRPSSPDSRIVGDQGDSERAMPWLFQGSPWCSGRSTKSSCLLTKLPSSC
jgi:hypothetical protein